MNRSHSLLGSFVLSASVLAGCPQPVVMIDDAGRDGGGTGLDTGPTDGGTGTDVPVLDVPTGGRTCSVGAGGCDVIEQGCPPDGTTAQGCYLSGDETMVSTVCAMSGTLGEGAACTGLNQCAEGLACQDGFCRDYCCMEAATDCAPGFICQPYGGPGGVTLPVGICVPPADCTVIPNAGCPAGNACVPTRDGTLLCASAGTNTVGMPCGDAMGACAPGLGCFGPTGGPFTCIEFCNLTGGTCTTAGATCMAQPAVVGGGFGLCIGG